VERAGHSFEAFSQQEQRKVCRYLHVRSCVCGLQWINKYKGRELQSSFVRMESFCARVNRTAARQLPQLDAP
jgi:hypothetical protein